MSKSKHTRASESKHARASKSKRTKAAFSDSNILSSDPDGTVPKLVRPRPNVSALGTICASVTFKPGVPVTGTVYGKVYPEADPSFPQQPPADDFVIGNQVAGTNTWVWNDNQTPPNPLPYTDNLPAPATLPTSTLVLWYQLSTDPPTTWHFPQVQFQGQTGTNTPCGGGNQQFNAPGGATWTCPAGVTSVKIECYGGGQKGGTSGVAGGKGGGYARKNAQSVEPSTDYDLQVGNGSDNTTGGDSWFQLPGMGGSPTTVCQAAGGNTGSSQIGDQTYTGGAGGTTNVGPVGGGGGGSSACNASNGNPGGNGSGSANGAGGVAPTSDGGNGGGGSNYNISGLPGVQPGGGGGASFGVGGAVGGDGAPGQVILTW